MHDYPQTMKITLIPNEFQSTADRDAFFDRMRSEVESESAEILKKISGACQNKADCDRRAKSEEEAKQKRLAEIEARRVAAKVRQDTRAESASSQARAITTLSLSLVRFC